MTECVGGTASVGSFERNRSPGRTVARSTPSAPPHRRRSTATVCASAGRKASMLSSGAVRSTAAERSPCRGRSWAVVVPESSAERRCRRAGPGRARRAGPPARGAARPVRGRRRGALAGQPGEQMRAPLGRLRMRGASPRGCSLCRSTFTGGSSSSGATPSVSSVMLRLPATRCQPRSTTTAGYGQ